MTKWLIIRNFTIGNSVLHEKMQTMKIFIDNGHGIDTPGKHSPDGHFLEYKFNREMAERIVSGLINRGLEAELLVGDFGSLHADTHVWSLGVIEPDNPFQYASAFIPCRYRYLVKPFNLQYSVRSFGDGVFQRGAALGHAHQTTASLSDITSHIPSQDWPCGIRSLSPR